MTAPASDLHRTFVDLPSDPDTDSTVIEWRLALIGGVGIGWAQLLEADRVLIVSEAGAGKTHECKERQRLLWNKGEPAFYLELASLGAARLEDHFDFEEQERYTQWREGHFAHATFFLDSIDELMLTPVSFELALKRFSKALHGHLDRARVVLTSRPIAFDREVAVRLLPVSKPEMTLAPDEEFVRVVMRADKPSEKVKNRQTWRYVALAPLDERQQRQLARMQGLVDVDPLMAAIAHHHAHDYARRPLDFIELCADWRRVGRIRSHRDQIESNIEVKLRPREDREEPVALTPEQARNGAARLALAALLTRRFTLWRGRDADRATSDPVLDPAQVLLDWSQEQIDALLQRALFGFATYGRVRFHHRSAIEYLAAEQLRTLLKAGMPMATVRRLLFVRTPVGHDAVRPSMRAVAAWLAPTLDWVRDELLTIDPGVLLQHGDPSTLTTTMRAEALCRYVAAYGAGGWRGEPVPQLQVERFASAELAAVVRELWEAGVSNPEVSELLLSLIGAGPMPTLADIALAAVDDAAAQLHVRLQALISLCDLNDPDVPGIVDRLMSGHSSWPNGGLTSVIVHLFPRHLTSTQLLAGLAHIVTPPREVGGLTDLLPRSIEAAKLERSELAQLLRGLVRLIEPTCRWDTLRHAIDSNRSDLVPTLLATLAGLIPGPADDDVARAAAMAASLAAGNVHATEHLKQLATALDQASSELRQKVFWACDGWRQQWTPDRDAQPWLRLSNLLNDLPLRVEHLKDWPWISAGLVPEMRPQPDRQLLLELAFHLVRGLDGAANVLRTLEASVKDDATLVAQLASMIHAHEHPEPEPEWKRKQRKHEQAQRRKDAKIQSDWLANRRDVIQSPDSAFSPARIENTVWNLWEAMRRSMPAGASGWNRPFLERTFSPDVAHRMRDAMKAAWRKDRPTLRSERPANEHDRYFLRWRLGLAAIYAESEDQQWGTRLTSDEARLAVRYALLELNGLPAWLEPVAQLFPDAVEGVIGNELDLELRETGPSSSHSMLLQQMSEVPEAIRSPLLRRIRAWLSDAMSGSVPMDWASFNADRSVQALLDHGGPADHEWLKAYCLQALTAGASQSELVFWLPVLMRVEPDSAIEWMEKLASAEPPTTHGPVVQWLSALLRESGRDERVLSLVSADPQRVLRLLKIAYAHVRPEDDVVHTSAYSPDSRDNAERARSTLLTALLDAKGPAGWEAKRAFADSPLASHFRDRALTIASARMAEECDRPQFTERDVAELERQQDFAPKTRGDMASLLRHRLSDLDDRLKQDSTPRSLWPAITIERELRRAVARELELMSREVYKVTQESVTGDEKETDIRLSSTASPQEAVIELKLGNNGYTVKGLRDALEHQLVGRYLQPETRRVGCLMISLAADREWKQPETGAVMTFDDVIALLRNDAKALEQRLGYDAYLWIHPLDLRKPSA